MCKLAILCFGSFILALKSPLSVLEELGGDGILQRLIDTVSGLQCCFGSDLRQHLLSYSQRLHLYWLLLHLAVQSVNKLVGQLVYNGFVLDERLVFVQTHV